VGYIQPYGLAANRPKRKRASDWSKPGPRKAHGERIWNVYGVKGSWEQDHPVRRLESELPAALREDLTFLKADFQRLLDMGYDPHYATSAYMRRPAYRQLPRKTAMGGSRRVPLPQAFDTNPVVPPHSGSSLFAMSESVELVLDQPAASLPRKTVMGGSRRVPLPQAFDTNPVVPPQSGSSLFAMSEPVGMVLDQPAASLPPLQFHDPAHYCVPYSLFNLVPLSDEEREHILTDLGAGRGKRCDVKQLKQRREKGCGWSVVNLKRPKIVTPSALYAYTQTKQARRRKFMVVYGTHAVGIDVKRGCVFDPAVTNALPLTLASLVACGMGEDELDVWVVLG